MARRKRASMREGPLADLFRSTTREEEEQPTQQQPAPEAPSEDETRVFDREGGTPSPPPPEPPQVHEEPEPEPEPAPPDPERVRAYRVDDIQEIPHAKERLSRIFAEEHDVEGPAYGREEPGLSNYHGPPRPHMPVIRVVGVGGAGVNAINRMIEAQIPGVEFMAINTDLQSLQQSTADVTVHLGSGVARGLGTGSNPELGYQSAFQEQDKIKRLLKGSDMVFITAGVGGGTGTGAAPVIARLARDVGALTVGIVTRPFGFEGTRRAKQAEKGIEALAGEVDTLIVGPNDRLLSVLERNTSMVEAFRVADDVLRQGVQGISDLITLPGLINLDFADVRTIMSDAGNALLGIGMGTGETRATDAARQAVASPLLETSVEGARAILLSITGGRDLSLWEVNEAAKAVAEAAHPDANIIFGAMVDDKVEDQVWVTVVATGYGHRPVHRARPRDEEHGRREGRGIPADAEPHVRRSRERVPAGTLMDVDVPEFLPRG